MNNLKNFSFVLVLLAFIVFVPIISFGQGTQTGGGPVGSGTQTGGGVSVSGTLNNPIKVNNLADLLRVILEGVIKISIPIIALAIIYSGFLFVSARGNSEKLETAKNALLYSAIGAAILLGSWAIAQIISETVLAL